MLGQVFFYEPNYSEQTIKETGRTAVIDYSSALDIYCETPNPASQMIKGETEEELRSELEILERNIKDPEWLEMLFNSI